MGNYRTQKCILKMEEKDLNTFDTLVSEYSGDLSARIILDGSAFTYHDFDHHCFNIYKIISNVLFEESVAYSQKIISSRELFLLNVAVLFHDISMSTQLETHRDNHSFMSAEYVRKEYEDSKSTLRKKTDLTSNEIKAIRAIIKAHSNIKDGSVIAQNNGLLAGDLREYTDINGNTINTRVLAGVLRIADELDVTNERLGTGSLEHDLEVLKRDNKEESDERERYLQSLEHWKKLHYISEVKRGNNCDEIELCVDDEYVLQQLDASNTERAIAKQLNEIKNGIQEKLDECVKLCFSKAPFHILVSAKKITICTEIESLERELNNLCNLKELQCVNINEKNRDDAYVTVAKNSNEKGPHLIDEELEKEIGQEIKKRDLIKYGHFRLNDNFCARDWINTRELVETKKILKKISGAMVKHISSMDDEDYLVVGIDMIGSLIAARVSYALQKPFSYVSSKREHPYNSLKELELEKSDKKIILITESIVSCDTINTVMREYEIEEQVSRVYTLLYRQSEEYDFSKTAKKPVFCINNTCPIELFDKTKCVYGDGNCKAINIRVIPQ